MEKPDPQKLKAGDTVMVYVYESLVYETSYVLGEDDFNDAGDVDESLIEESLLSEGIDWNACDVTRREVQVYPAPQLTVENEDGKD